jgi:hypothetical protein
LSAWSGKVCARCGGGKGTKYRDKKFCGRCQHAIKYQRSQNAHARALEKRYGITREDYEALYAFQDGHCYICRRATGATRRLTVDHDHATGLVRGLLCRPCNSMLGHLRDDSAAFQRVLDYLADPPWSILVSKRNGGSNGNGHRG